jgi:hypothetical protein
MFIFIIIILTATSFDSLTYSDESILVWTQVSSKVRDSTVAAPVRKETNVTFDLRCVAGE